MKFSTNKLSVIAAAILAAGSLTAQVYPTAVLNYNPGPLADGVSTLAIDRPVRSHPAEALGVVVLATQDVNVGESGGNVDFVSLGYGGSIELEFASPICNIVGNDFKVWETSYGTPNCVAWPEHAAVWARQDLCQDWVLLTADAGVCQDFEVELGFLSYARYIRIEDRTDETFPAFQSSNQDAFDVDGVEGFVTCSLPVIDPANMYSPFAEVTVPGLRSNGTAVPAARAHNERMLGAPQMSDATTSPANNNFRSLGFGGVTTLQFPMTIINVAGPDIAAYETTFGDNLGRPCAVYPERARFEGSVDGSFFFDLEVEVTPNDPAGAILCRDGILNIPAAYGGINYVRITDVSTAGSFGGVVDAYDVDGLIALNQQSFPCAPIDGSNQRVIDESASIGEGEYGISLYPNPADKTATIEVSATNSNDDYTIRVIDITGRIISTESVNNGSGSFIHNLNISNLPAGIYIVTVDNNEMREVTRLIKK